MIIIMNLKTLKSYGLRLREVQDSHTMRQDHIRIIKFIEFQMQIWIPARHIKFTLIRLFIPCVCTDLQGSSYNFSVAFVGRTPIHTIDFSNPHDVDLHNKMVSLVEKMLDLNKRFASSMTEHEKTMLSRQIQATDDQINTLVYALYELNEEEIRIVESQAP